MSNDLRRQIAAIEKMTVKELRQRHVELFGEENRSSNRQYLFRRIAWRLQALAEGGLAIRLLGPPLSHLPSPPSLRRLGYWSAALRRNDAPYPTDLAAVHVRLLAVVTRVRQQHVDAYTTHCRLHRPTEMPDKAVAGMVADSPD